MATTKTLLAFPAAHWPKADEVEVDLTDVVEPVEDDEPTLPLLAPPERTTERPSGEMQAALVAATRDAPAWLQGPRYAHDPGRGLVLAEPYLARVTDPHGTTYLVECPVGSPAGDGSMRALLAGALPRVSHVRILPQGQTVELLLVLDEQWRRDIIAVC